MVMDLAKDPCFLCGSPSVTVHRSRSQSLVFKKWSSECSIAFCQLLNLDPKFSTHFQKANYCESCLETYLDVFYLQNNISKLQDRLQEIAAKSMSLIDSNQKLQFIKNLEFVYFKEESFGERDSDSIEPVVESFAAEASVLDEPAYTISSSKETTSEKKGEKSDRKYINEKLVEKFGTHKLFSIHSSFFPVVRDSDGKKVKFECGLCPEVFTKEVFYKAHLKSEHENDEHPYECTHCAEKLGSIHNLCTHLLHNHVQFDFECDICQLGFSTLKSYQKHRSAHRDAVLQQRCSYCAKKFTPEELVLHEDLHRNTQNPSDCVLCEEKFECKLYLEEHVRTVHVCRLFVCKESLCSASFERSSELLLHVKRMHAPDPRFVCEICNVQFCNKQQLEAHALSHSNLRPVKCTYTGCLKSFKTVHKQKLHAKRVHEKVEDLFKCHLCPKAFSTRHGLKSHILYHSTDRPFLCDKCAYAGKTRENLWNHVNITHRKQEFVNIKRKRRYRITERIICKYTPTGIAKPKEKTEMTCPLTPGGPCHVCANPNGVLYENGLSVCRGCLVFFQNHMFKQPEELEACRSDGCCVISSTGRTACISCRLNKCLEVGMIYGMSAVKERAPEREKIEQKANLGERKANLRERGTAPCVGCGKEASLNRKGFARCSRCYNFLWKTKLTNATFYVCKYSGNCEVTEDKRPCSYCRFQKLCQFDTEIKTLPLEKRVAWNGPKKRGVIVLPKGPCVGCGDETTRTFRKCYRCKACYGFQRKARLNSITYSCPRDGNCEINIVSRKSCGFCRMQKLPPL